MVRQFLWAAMMAAGVALPVSAQSIEYAYTKIDLKTCKHTPGRIVEDYGAWLCKGHESIPIYITGGDQRAFVSFGQTAKRQVATRESLMSFNAQGDVVEWRIETLGAKKSHSPQSCAGRRSYNRKNRTATESPCADRCW